MDEHEWLAERVEEKCTHLRAVAYRMLGSLSEADDAVQKVWLRLPTSGFSRSRPSLAPSSRHRGRRTLRTRPLP